VKEAASFGKLSAKLLQEALSMRSSSSCNSSTKSSVSRQEILLQTDLTRAGLMNSAAVSEDRVTLTPRQSESSNFAQLPF